MIKNNESTLWKILTNNYSEDELYKNYFSKDFWTIKQFSALAVNISPEKHKKLIESKKKLSACDVSKILKALELENKLLDQIVTQKIKNFHSSGKDIIIPTWYFIKWVAENKIPITYNFFKSLPFDLMQLYIEFQPINIMLRTKPNFSRDYHEAYYLKHAKELTYNNPMTNEQIFQNPKMQNVMRYIRDLGGSYKKSTIIKSWLPKLDPKRQKGRPKKN